MPKGGFVYQKHNEVRDILAHMIGNVRKDVMIEPQLEPLTGEVLPPGTICYQGARADISAMGF